jgi:hypothetical protein
VQVIRPIHGTDAVLKASAHVLIQRLARVVHTLGARPQRHRVYLSLVDWKYFALRLLWFHRSLCSDSRDRRWRQRWRVFAYVRNHQVEHVLHLVSRSGPIKVVAQNIMRHFPHRPRHAALVGVSQEVLKKVYVQPSHGNVSSNVLCCGPTNFTLSRFVHLSIAIRRWTLLPDPSWCMSQPRQWASCSSWQAIIRSGFLLM